MKLEFPVLKKPINAIKIFPDGTKEEKIIGYEMWAKDMPRRDGVKNILFDPGSPWLKLWEQAYFTQNNIKNVGIDILDFNEIYYEYIGEWEGFSTSFNWQGIKFVDVYIQLVAGKRYFIPTVLIKEIKEKLTTKISKLDAFEFTKEENLSINWNANDNIPYYFKGLPLDNFGKIN